MLLRAVTGGLSRNALTAIPIVPPQRKDHPKDTGFGAKTDDSEGPIEPESVGGVKTVRFLADKMLRSLGSPSRAH